MIGRFERCAWILAIVFVSTVAGLQYRENDRLRQRLMPVEFRRTLTDSERAHRWELLEPVIDLHRQQQLNGTPSERFEELLEMADAVISTPAITWYQFEGPDDVQEGLSRRNISLTVINGWDGCPRIVYASQPVYVP